MRDPRGSLTSLWVITDERRDAKPGGNAVRANQPPHPGRQLPLHPCHSAGSGMGRVIALSLAEEGANVTLFDPNLDAEGTPRVVLLSRAIHFPGGPSSPLGGRGLSLA